MQIKFWGTRGSLPRATTDEAVLDLISRSINCAKQRGINNLDEYYQELKAGRLIKPLTFGGNTSCTQVTHGQDTIFLDSGSGFAFAGDELMAKGQKVFHLFMTHFHWDHILGLPFFLPVFVPGMTLHIYHVHRTGEDDVKIQFNGRNFPVMWDQLGANIHFHRLKLYSKATVGSLEVTPFSLDHPGGSFGYRVEGGGHSMALGVDGEFKRHSRVELGPDLKYYQNLDLLIFDAQYDRDELANKYDWGHSTPSLGVELALREGIRNLILSHHDPRTSDEKTLRMLDEAKTYCSKHISNYQEIWQALNQPHGPRIESAYDGLDISFDAHRLEIR